MVVGYVVYYSNGPQKSTDPGIKQSVWPCLTNPESQPKVNHKKRQKWQGKYVDPRDFTTAIRLTAWISHFIAQKEDQFLF